MALKPAPSRDPCLRCGVPGFKGCEHFAPCEPVSPSELGSLRFPPRHHVGGLTKNGNRPGAGKGRPA